MLGELNSALKSSRYTTGSTHNFYLYPARFSPEIARTVISSFSEPGDWILDPFMGGGTTVVEGLMLGRSVIGVDINALAHFVCEVRTRPLSRYDEDSLRWWAEYAARRPYRTEALSSPHVINLPLPVRTFLASALERSDHLLFPRQRAFARCVLLRLGQWALDCKDHAGPSQGKVAKKLLDLTERMIKGLHDFVEVCRTWDLRKSEIVGRRVLLCRNAAGLHEDKRFYSLGVRPRLIFTSPPYPGVHVLYHRWQVRGRKETPAPYWIAQVPDGFHASHYMGGSRSPTGERNYFSMLRSAFLSLKNVLAPDGMVVQLVGFADLRRQLPIFLESMAEAGFEEWAPSPLLRNHLGRRVPNRKWYAKLKGAVDASSEILLFHRPRRRK